MRLARGIDPKAVGKYGDTLESILRERRLEPEERQDPAYLGVIARLQSGSRAPGH
jgi:hypothetical protein